MKSITYMILRIDESASIEQALWPNIIMLFRYFLRYPVHQSGLTGFREAFNVLKEAGCSDEALCYEL